MSDAALASRPQMSWMRLLIAVVGGIFCALVALEVFARFLYSNQAAYSQNDPATGLIRSVPYAQYTVSGSCYSNTITANRYGFYGPDVPPEKPAGTRRIALIGNSFVESAQLPLDDGFAAILGRDLSKDGPPVQTASFGVAGNGTYLDMVYEHHYADQLHPDIVFMLATEGNPPEDLPSAPIPPRYDADGHVILDLPAQTSNSVLSWLKNLSRKSSFFVQLAGKYHLAAIRLRGVFHPHATEPDAVATPAANVPDAGDTSAATISDAAWDAEAHLLAEEKRLTQAQGSTFVLASWNGSDGIKSSLGEHYAAIASKLGIPFLDLNTVMGSDDPTARASIVWSCDAHWNPAGHEAAGHAIANFLRAHPEVWPKN